MAKTFYVVMVTPEASFSKVNQEAYATFEEAVKFVTARAGNPKPISSHVFRDDEYTEYEICEVTV